MQIPKYKPDHEYSYWEMVNNHPEFADMLNQQDSWSQYEQKPDLMSLPPEIVKMIPQNVRDGKEDDRIDAWFV